MNAGEFPMVTTPHTIVTVDATEFARLCERLASYADMSATADDATPFTAAYAAGAASAYRSILETVTRMVEAPDESPFVVQGAPVIIASRPVLPAKPRGV